MGNKNFVKNINLRLNFAILLVILVLSIQSCSKKKYQVESMIDYWNKKEIFIPKVLKFKSIGRDTNCLPILNHKYKVLVYIDSLGCTACHLEMPEWAKFMESCKSKAYDVSYLFVVQSNRYFDFEHKLKIYGFTYPIIYDPKDEFNKLNKFPKEDKYRTFLLDERNRVIIIGSPLNNEKIRALYETVLGGGKIRKLEQTDNITNNKSTTVELNKDSVNLGKFSFQSTKIASFQLRNIGKDPLVVQSVNTSCGCTVAKYDKKPITQGETTTVVLEYKPNSLGYFSKTADVVCNVPEGYIRLKISGEVVEK